MLKDASTNMLYAQGHRGKKACLDLSGDKKKKLHKKEPNTNSRSEKMSEIKTIHWMDLTADWK